MATYIFIFEEPVHQHCLAIDADTCKEAMEKVDRSLYPGIFENSNFKVYRWLLQSGVPPRLAIARPHPLTGNKPDSSGITRSP
jgi:hypothetical protein